MLGFSQYEIASMFGLACSTVEEINGKFTEVKRASIKEFQQGNS